MHTMKRRPNTFIASSFLVAFMLLTLFAISRALMDAQTGEVSFERLLPEIARKVSKS